MKPHPRIRKTIKWGGAAVTVLLVAAWIGSAWMSVAWGGRNGVYASAARGCLYVKYYGPADADDRWAKVIGPGYAVRTTPTEGSESNLGKKRSAWPLGFSGSINSTPALEWHLLWDAVSIECSFSLFFFPAVVGAVTLVAWRLDTLARRRAKLNLCPKCNYDRTGLASKDAKCPECGVLSTPSLASSGQSPDRQ